MKKFIDIINEYQEIPHFDYTVTPFSDTNNPLGSINSVGDKFLIHKKENEHEVSYGAIEPDQTIPKAVIIFAKTSGNALIAGNAWVDPNFQKRGLASELMNFVLYFENKPILSDTQMTRAGINLWKSLIRSVNISAKLYNAQNHHLYELADIGKNNRWGKSSRSKKR